MARIQEFYKGRRKRRNYAIVPFVIMLGLAALLVVTFYGMQQYAVITSDGVSVRFPMFDEGDDNTVADSLGHERHVFERVETQLVFDEPDYSRIQATAGRYMTGIRAIFVPYTDLTSEKISEYTSRLRLGNALVLEMKPRSGLLMWNSQSDAARGYGLAVTAEQSAVVERIIQDLKENPPNGKDIYLAAQISCCIDELYPSRSTSVALRTELGLNYSDDKGTWLDPYNADLRNYVVQMVRELYDMGFDEVILADVEHPTAPEVNGEKINFVYSRDMSTTPNPVTAICGFAVSVAQQLSDRDGALSIYCTKPQALVRADEVNGQDAVLFMKLYDRVYYATDTGTYTNYNLKDIEDNVTIGSARIRFVPVLTNYLFSDAGDTRQSWVLVDAPTGE